VWDAHRRLVQEGYDRIGQRYLAARTRNEGEDLALLSDLAILWERLVADPLDDARHLFALAHRR
jgi:hypothetical protein